jgi:hypothetical protein
MPSRIRILALAFGLAVTACSFADATPVELPRPSPSNVGTITAETAQIQGSARPGPERPLLDSDIAWDENPMMRVLGGVTRTVKHTEYRHSRSVDVARGVYIFDCSLMVQWALEHGAPVAARSIAGGLGRRPLAADYQRHFARLTPQRERGGWRRVERIQDAQPGDVLAWIKPKIIDSPNTGHVAFVVLPPTRVSGYSDAYLVRIADATRLAHDDDTRGEGSGFGFGTILLVIDPDTGAPRAYGWVALRWRAFETAIAIARPTR